MHFIPVALSIAFPAVYVCTINNNNKKIKIDFMKQLFIILALITASFSMQASEISTVNPIVLKSFQKTFTSASEVNWVSNSEIAIVEFRFNNQHITAYYSCNGNLLGLRKNLLSTELPVLLSASLKEQFGNYWITDLMEYGNQGETNYYVTLEDGNTRIILKSSVNSWTVFHKAQK
jgi:hypothetical protein